MRYKHLLALLGLALILLAVLERGWAWLAAWVGFDYLALSFAHARGIHRLFGKRPDGTLPSWAWIVFLPMLAYMTAVWHLARIFRHKTPRSQVTGRLSIGRRLLASELDEEFDNYVDLTAEFAEPVAIRGSAAYRSFPILNDAAPSPEALHAAVRSLQPGRTFVHCGRGYGRSALFAVAILLTTGGAHSVEEGLRILGAARPGVRLNREQRKCVEMYANLWCGGKG
jgi:hypothetical protein